MNYYKRHWDETTGNELTDSWGTSTYYFETDENNYVLRQVELYNNGIGLKYWEQYLQDDFGKLAENLLNPEDFEPYRIEKDEFEKVWATDYKNP